MIAILQRTKLFIPPARPALVNRPRLLARLDELRAEGSRIALVSAPAGAGKTTLVVQWLSQMGWPAAWLSLDASDNLPAQFFAYLIAAWQTAVPGAGQAALSLLDLPGIRVEEIVAALTNDLLAASGAGVLVLDDIHLISNPDLHRALDLLVDALPAQLRLVLLTREDPPIALARRRARGQLVDVRQQDLRFSAEEAGQFLNQTMRLGLSAHQVAALEDRIEGWAAGLQLAALALRAAPQVDRLIADFSGSHQFVLDYLMEEVLARQSPPTQRFLLESSVFGRLCGDLCAAALGLPEAEAQLALEQLARANLFLIPLDSEGRWYRYHHLFRDLLQARLRAAAPARAAELERRASDWFEAHHEHRQAVECALRAGDPRRAADLVERHMATYWQTANMEFHLLVGQLPAEIVAERPSLSLQRAWLAVMLGQTEQILPLVEAAERSLASPDPAANPNGAAQRAFARVLRAYVADLNNQPVALDSALELALESIPESNPGMRNSVAVVLGSIYFMEANFAGAQWCFEVALELDRRVQGANAVPIATQRLAYVLQAQRRLREAEQRLSEAEAYVQAHGSRRFYISGALNFRRGEILLEWGQLEEAEAELREGQRLMEDWPIPQIHSLGLGLQARLQTTRGNLAGARATLESLATLQAQTRLHPLFLDAVEQARLGLYRAEDNRPALEAWAQMNASAALRPLCFRYEARQLLLAQAWIALGRLPEAQALLERLAEASTGRHGSQVTILVWLAAAQAAPQALDVLDKALRLAEPESYVRTFVEAGDPIRQRLTAWLHSPYAKASPARLEYARQLLAAFGATAPATTLAAIPEPLSPREQEVLQLVAEGLTNPQIASRLIISVRTVKKHVENLHGKLDAQNRTQAVARARELGLLPPQKPRA